MGKDNGIIRDGAKGGNWARVINGALHVRLAGSSGGGSLFPSMTPGSVVFIGANGQPTEDNANFKYVSEGRLVLEMGDHNIAIGVDAGLVITSGSYNILIGDSVGKAITTGVFNIGMAGNSLLACTSGSQNVCLGVSAGRAITTGSNNMAIGVDALKSVVTGSQNVAVGSGGLTAATSDNNVSIGHIAFQGLTSGDRNTAVGQGAGTGDGTTNMRSTVDTLLTCLGFRASRSGAVTQATVLTNSVALGANSKIAASNTVYLGASCDAVVDLNFISNNVTASRAAVWDANKKLISSTLPSVTGNRLNPESALKNLLTALGGVIITDSTTAT